MRPFSSTAGISERAVGMLDLWIHTPCAARSGLGVEIMLGADVCVAGGVEVKAACVGKADGMACAGLHAARLRQMSATKKRDLMGLL